MPGEYNAIRTFEKYSSEIGNWESIKKKYLHIGIGEEAEEDFVQKDADQIKALIKHRDIIDFYIYRRSVERIFPSMFYNLSARVNGKLEYQGDHPRFKATWYEFIVTKRAELLHASEEASSCVIKINSPGSRNLTSDIDTSIGTKFSGNISRILEQCELNIKDKGPDFSGRITNNIVDGFYTISEQEFGITSGEHRDSNAYVELLDEKEYPKFKDDETRNPKVGGDNLFISEEFIIKLTEYKGRKHILEMAASLFSLRDALDAKETKEWDELKKQMNAEIDNCANKFVGDEQQEKSYIDASKKDLKEVFEKTEQLYLTYEKHLSEKEEIVEKSNYGKNSKLNGADKARDIKVAALNRLYYEFLEKMTDINGKIIKVESENKQLIIQADDLHKKLQKEFKRLENFKNDPEIHDEDIPESERKYASLRKEFESKIESLKKNIINILDMQIEKLEARYQAHTFANEAYVCRSAVYHVVNGMQEGGNVDISEQTLLGSLLQQVGFKLLHTKELLKRDKSPEEAIYRTSKYTQRIKHLLFNKPEITNDNIKRAIHKEGPNSLGIFSRLKSIHFKDRLFKIFSPDELTLINSEAQVVSKIKNKPNLLENDRHKETAILLQETNAQSSKPLFLSIASKTIAGTYLSKLDRKGALWGQAAIVHRPKSAELEIPMSSTQQFSLNSSNPQKTEQQSNNGAQLMARGARSDKSLTAKAVDHTGHSSFLDASQASSKGDMVLSSITHSTHSSSVGLKSTNNNTNTSKPSFTQGLSK